MVTQFAPEHPGGQRILLKYAGKDATEVRLPHLDPSWSPRAPAGPIRIFGRSSRTVLIPLSRPLLPRRPSESSPPTQRPRRRHPTDRHPLLYPRSEPIHPPGTLEQYLPKEKHLGDVDLTGMEIVAKEETQEEKERKQREANKPAMDECLSLYDFEVRAVPTLTHLRGRDCD